MGCFVICATVCFLAPMAKAENQSNYKPKPKANHANANKELILVPPPPPQFEVQPLGATVRVVEAVLFERLLSVELADSLATIVLVIDWPTVPALTFASIISVAVELAAKFPIVHKPVEVA